MSVPVWECAGKGNLTSPGMLDLDLVNSWHFTDSSWPVIIHFDTLTCKILLIATLFSELHLVLGLEAH